MRPALEALEENFFPPDHLLLTLAQNDKHVLLRLHVARQPLAQQTQSLPEKPLQSKQAPAQKNRSPCSCLKLIEKCGHHPGVVLSDNAVGFTQLTLVPASNQIYFLTTCLSIHILALAVPMSPTLHIGDNLHLQNLIPRKCSIRIGPLIILETQMWGKTLSDRRWT